MARDYSRRDFLKVSGMGVAAAVATKAVAELPFGAGDGAAATAPRGAISVCATSDKLRQAQGTPLAWQPAAVKLYKEPNRISKATLTTCVKLLTLHAGKDRFVSGHLGCMIQEGHIALILKRLQAIRSGRSVGATSQR
jgi:hypothetical protein